MRRCWGTVIVQPQEEKVWENNSIVIVKYLKDNYMEDRGASAKGQETMVTNCSKRNSEIHCEWSSPETGCPERLRSLCSQRFSKPDWTRPWAMWSNFEVLEAHFKPSYVIWRSLTRFLLCSSKAMLLHKAVWQAHLCIQVYCHRLTIQSSMHILTIMPLEKSMLSYTNFLVLAYCQILEFALRQSLLKPWRKQCILQCHYFIVTYLNRNCMWANWNYVRAVGAKSGSS